MDTTQEGKTNPDWDKSSQKKQALQYIAKKISTFDSLKKKSFFWSTAHFRIPLEPFALFMVREGKEENIDKTLIDLGG